MLYNIYIYYIYKYKNLPLNAIVRLPHPRSEIARTRKHFQHPLLTRKPATVTHSASIYNSIL